jgi:hypothetical protein
MSSGHELKAIEKLSQAVARFFPANICHRPR